MGGSHRSFAYCPDRCKSIYQQYGGGTPCGANPARPLQWALLGARDQIRTDEKTSYTNPIGWWGMHLAWRRAVLAEQFLVERGNIGGLFFPRPWLTMQRHQH